MRSAILQFAGHGNCGFQPVRNAGLKLAALTQIIKNNRSRDGKNVWLSKFSRDSSGENGKDDLFGAPTNRADKGGPLFAAMGLQRTPYIVAIVKGSVAIEGLISKVDIMADQLSNILLTLNATQNTVNTIQEELWAIVQSGDFTLNPKTPKSCAPLESAPGKSGSDRQKVSVR